MVFALLIIFFSAISVFLMSYMTMNTELGPWVAPLFIVMCTMFAIPLLSRRLFAKYATIMIAAGSIGGMVGMCLGLSIPSFYFVHKAEFLMMMARPLHFAGLISMFVLCAGAFAFVLAYLLKDHLIIEKKLPFPMVKLLHDIISIDSKSSMSSGHRLMLSGLGLVSVFNMLTMMARPVLHVFRAQIHIIPFMMTAGFVAGRLTLIPVCIGVGTRILAFQFVHHQFFASMHEIEFLITFCSGILLALFLRVWLHSFVIYRQIKDFFPKSIKLFMQDWRLLLLGVGTFLCSCVPLYFCGVSWEILIYLMSFLIITCWNIARILGQIGVVDIVSFSWFIILPLIYGVIAIPSSSVVAAALFAMLCLGMVIDLIFSYKLASLAKISYQKILQYQLLGFVTTILISGFAMWWHIHTFGFDSAKLTSPQALELGQLIQFGAYDHVVLLCGVACGIILQMFRKEMFTIVGAALMMPSMSIWLIIAGVLSHVVKNPEKLYPMWFGVYAGQVCWIVMRLVI